MPPKLPVGPPNSTRPLVFQDRTFWPKEDGFHEESAKRPIAQQYLNCGRRFVGGLAPGERGVYVQNVVAEATKRLMCLHLFLQPRRDLLVGYQHARRTGKEGLQHEHVKYIQRELAWERQKRAVQRNYIAWRQYRHERPFLAWLETVSSAQLESWAALYLPAAHRRRLDLRRRLAEIAPMPEDIRRAYFLATSDHRQIRALVGIEAELDTYTEYHVCLVSQRLLAYHTATNAKYGPVHLQHLTKLLARKRAFNRPDWMAPHYLLEVIQDQDLLCQGRVTKQSAETTMVRVRAAVQVAQETLRGERELDELLPTLIPDRLELEACDRCSDRMSAGPEEDQLPPFGALCRCFRLAWRRSEMDELQRKMTLWALECALKDDQAPRFPFEEFIAACDAVNAST